jgi:hypothetical protein
MNYQTTPDVSGQDDTFTYRERHAHRHDVIERVIWAVSSFLLTMLATRFVFALLGANPANGFANFIYDFTAPLTTPFYSLFSYDHPSLGAAAFQGYTLIAMATYGLGAVALARLVSITRY